jgi:FKBP-type peptidyl-prolyl cis-trans isomerase FklB
MKHTITRRLRETCGLWIMVAVTPLAGAQAPSPPPGASPPASAAAPQAPAVPSADQISYVFGLTFGEQMRRAGVTNEVNLDQIASGVKDGLQGKKTTPSDQRELQAYVRSLNESIAARNQAAAKDFLARNTHEKGVTTTASGLQYKIILPGDRKAAAIAPTDTVTVQYRGKLLDGSEFDSTYARGEPAHFPVNGVIKGWQEALVLMKPGAKWQLFVPPELGYGAGSKPGIPGGSLLIFEVELMSVKPAAAPAATPSATSLDH